MTRVLVGWFAFLFLFIPRVAVPACEFRLVSSHPFRATAFDVALDGNHLWVATAFGVEVRSADGTVLHRLALPGTTSRVWPSGERAFVASGSSIFLLTATPPAIISSIDVGSPINDLLVINEYAFAAAGTGVVQVDFVIPARPAVVKTHSTSTGVAFSLARGGNIVFAADGDATVEQYSVQVPALTQRAGEVASLPRGNAVHVFGSLLFVSDGHQTDVFTGVGGSLVRMRTLSGVGGTAVHPLSSTVFFMAGLDRVLHAVDITTGTTLFEESLPVTAGNVNRIGAIGGSADRIFAAAGDVGLVQYDVSSFRDPFPLRAYAIAPARSVIESASTVFASFDEGGIRAFARDASGILTQRYVWDEARQSTLHDASGSLLLSAAGSSLFLWEPGAAPPSAPISSALFRAPIRAAILIDRTAYAVLTDQSLWRADLAATNVTPVAVSVAGSRPMFIARDGNAIAIADLEENGTTTLRYFANGDLSVTPPAISIEGLATTGIAVSSSGFVAGTTFRGVTVADFSSGGSSILAGTTGVPTRDLHFSGDDLFVLNATGVQVWSVSLRELRRQFELPAEGVSLHRTADEVTVATSEGLATIDAQSSRTLPQRVGEFSSNSFFRKVVAGGDHLYLFDGRNVAVYGVGASGIPSFVRQVALSGNVVDIAASSDRLFTLSSSGRVAALRIDGSAESEFQMQEGDDVQPLSLHVVRGAVYASLSRGCLGGACEKKTLVMDPRDGRLLHTFTLAGATTDVVVSNATGYAIFDVVPPPKEIRVLNLSDPFRPAITTSRAADGDPVSITFSAPHGSVFTLGDRLYAYTAASLSPLGAQLSNWAVDPTTRLSRFDQAVRVLSGDCAVIAGRAFNPELRQTNNASDWTIAQTPRVPSPVRSVAMRQGILYLLSDHSLEVWSSLSLNTRRRSAR